MANKTLNLTSEDLKVLEIELNQLTPKNFLQLTNKLKRFKLIEYYKNLILNNLSNDSINDFELKLWKLGFYQPVELYRLLINQEGTKLSFQFGQFLTKSIGFYINLVGEIDTVLSCNLLDKVTNYDLNKWEFNNNNIPISMYFKSFIRMGDLARYQIMETNSTWAAIIPDYYYRIALKLVKNLGHPYNQLGVLSGLKQDYLNAIHFYFRSVLIEVPFPTSMTNLRGILNKLADYEINPTLNQLDTFKLIVPKLISQAYLNPEPNTLTKLKIKFETCLESLLKTSIDAELQELLNFTIITLISAKEVFSDYAKPKFYSDEGSDQLDLILTTYGNLLIKTAQKACSEPFKTLEKMPEVVRVATPPVLIYSCWILDQFSRDTRQHSCILEACNAIFTFSNIFADVKIDVKGKRPVALPELQAYKHLSIIGILEGSSIEGSQTPTKAPKKKDAFRIKKLREISKLLEVKQEQADDELVFEDLSKNIEDHYRMDVSDADDIDLKSQPTPTLYGMPPNLEDDDEGDEILNIPNLSNPVVTNFGRKGSAFNLSSDRSETNQSNLYGLGNSSHYLNSSKPFNPSTVSSHFGQGSSAAFGARSKSFTNFGNFFVPSTTIQSNSTTSANFSLLGGPTSSGTNFDTNNNLLNRGVLNNSAIPSTLASTSQFNSTQDSLFGSTFTNLSSSSLLQDIDQFEASQSAQTTTLHQFSPTHAQSTPTSTASLFAAPSLRYPRPFERNSNLQTGKGVGSIGEKDKNQTNKRDFNN